MNFFTIVAKLGFEGLDFVWEDRSDGLEDLTTSAFEEVDEDEEFSLSCLVSCSVDEDGSEKCEEVEERVSYELYREWGFSFREAIVRRLYSKLRTQFLNFERERVVFFGEGEEDEEVCCLIMNGCEYFKDVFF